MLASLGEEVILETCTPSPPYDNTYSEYSKVYIYSTYDEGTLAS